MLGLLQGANLTRTGLSWRKTRESEGAESANQRTVTVAHETCYGEKSAPVAAEQVT
jgi:hypothetical protein